MLNHWKLELGRVLDKNCLNSQNQYTLMRTLLTLTGLFLGLILTAQNYSWHPLDEVSAEASMEQTIFFEEGGIAMFRKSPDEWFRLETVGFSRDGKPTKFTNSKLIRFVEAEGEKCLLAGWDNGQIAVFVVGAYQQKTGFYKGLKLVGLKRDKTVELAQLGDIDRKGLRGFKIESITKGAKHILIPMFGKNGEKAFGGDHVVVLNAKFAIEYSEHFDGMSIYDIGVGQDGSAAVLMVQENEKSSIGTSNVEGIKQVLFVEGKVQITDVMLNETSIGIPKLIGFQGTLGLAKLTSVDGMLSNCTINYLDASIAMNQMSLTIPNAYRVSVDTHEIELVGTASSEKGLVFLVIDQKEGNGKDGINRVALSFQAGGKLLNGMELTYQNRNKKMQEAYTRSNFLVSRDQLLVCTPSLDTAPSASLAILSPGRKSLNNISENMKNMRFNFHTAASYDHSIALIMKDVSTDRHYVSVLDLEQVKYIYLK